MLANLLLVGATTIWALFSFEALPVSRWKTLRFQIELAGSGHLVGTEQGPARVAFYGGGQVDERLGPRSNALLWLFVVLLFGLWVARFAGFFGGPAPV